MQGWTSPARLFGCLCKRHTISYIYYTIESHIQFLSSEDDLGLAQAKKY